MNNQQTFKRECKRGVIGPGGMRCHCCNRLHSGRSQKTTKQALNRIHRRKSKTRLVSEVIETIED